MSAIELPQGLGYVFYGHCLYGFDAFPLSAPACRSCAGSGEKLLGTAYNGAPMGVADCSEAGCMISEEYELVVTDGQEEMVKTALYSHHSCGAEFALFTDRIDREGSSVYVTDEPCWTCANMLANSGVTEIRFHRSYPKDTSKVKI